MAEISVLSPPLAFAILLTAVLGLSLGLSRLAYRPPAGAEGSSAEPYACGELIGSHMMQPDYGQFLPFAFFFTILHVIALLATTVPVATVSSLVIAVAYLVCAVVGLFVLYAR